MGVPSLSRSSGVKPGPPYTLSSASAVTRRPSPSSSIPSTIPSRLLSTACASLVSVTSKIPSLSLSRSSSLIMPSLSKSNKSFIRSLLLSTQTNDGQPGVTSLKFRIPSLSQSFNGSNPALSSRSVIPSLSSSISSVSTTQSPSVSFSQTSSAMAVMPRTSPLLPFAASNIFIIFDVASAIKVTSKRFHPFSTTVFADSALVS